MFMDHINNPPNSSQQQDFLWLPGWLNTMKLLLPTVLLVLFSNGLKSQTPPPLCPGTEAIQIKGDDIDWPTVINNAINSKRAFRRDVSEFNGNSHKDDGFTQGTSNNAPIEDWSWVYGNTNDKGDIENAGTVRL